ncbi:hypothetical protein C2849_19225 [Aeromonas veronii]|nr:hypothetical protein C2849_19225 [Aeromonas veronii]
MAVYTRHDYAVLNGTQLIPTTEILWEVQPQSLGCGMACWRRLYNWQVQGIWLQLHVTWLTQLATSTGLMIQPPRGSTIVKVWKSNWRH